MGFLCFLLSMVVILWIGFFQIFAGMLDWALGVKHEEEEPDEEDFLTDSGIEDPSTESVHVEEEPFDVEALLDSLSFLKYECVHRVTLSMGKNRHPLSIDHLVLSANGVFFIRRLELDGVINTMSDVGDWLHIRGDKCELFPSPRKEIQEAAWKAARRLRLKREQVIPLVVSAGSAKFGDDMPKGVLYARNLLRAIKRRKTTLLSPEEFVQVGERLDQLLE